VRDRTGDLRSAVVVSQVAVGWGTVTGALSVYAGARSASLGLIGTGCDVLADVVGSLALIWRFRAELRGAGVPAAAERRAHHATAGGLLVVAFGLAVSGVVRLIAGDRPTVDVLTVVVAAVSLVGLPLLAAWKYRIAPRVVSPALRTDAHTTVVGAGTAAVTLLGLAVTTAFDWYAADAVAALVIAAIAATAGIAGIREAGSTIDGGTAPA